MAKQTFLNLPEDKRQKIVEAALEEFAANSYPKASLSGIVNRAGIAKGSMYQYFEDKKDLYCYILDLAVDEKIAYVSRNVKPGSGFFAELEESILASARFSLEHPQYSRVIVNAIDSVGEDIMHNMGAKWKEMGIRYFENMLRRGQETGEIRPGINIRLAGTLMYYLLSVGMGQYLLESLGLELKTLLTDPNFFDKLPESKIREAAREVVDLLRAGLARQGANILWSLLF